MQPLTIDAPSIPVCDQCMAQPKDVFRRAREAQSLTQAELAHQAKVSPASVHRLEKGKSPNDGDVAKKVGAALGLDIGRSLSGRRSTEPENTDNLPSSMGQMIGRMQLPATAQDYYEAVLELAIERKDPADVFRDLALARSEAPADAGIGWWMRRYLAAVDRTAERK